MDVFTLWHLVAVLAALAAGIASWLVHKWDEADEAPSMDDLLAEIDRAHPGWRELVCTPQFRQWLYLQHPSVRGWAHSMNPARAIQLLDLYKHRERRRPRLLWA